MGTGTDTGTARTLHVGSLVEVDLTVGRQELRVVAAKGLTGAHLDHPVEAVAPGHYNLGRAPSVARETLRTGFVNA